VIVWVLVLRSLAKKRELEDRQKAGLSTPGPVSFDTLKKTLEEVSERPLSKVPSSGSLVYFSLSLSLAIGRYDTHRKLVTEEVNEISAAYLRLDLLPKEQQNQFRQNFRAYVTSRLDHFDSEKK
jgi:hypothetical protein